MNDLQIDLVGSPINIRYQMHGNYIEWRVVSTQPVPTHHEELLFTLIRMHYTIFIESIIKEHYHWKMEEEARAHPPEDPPF